MSKLFCNQVYAGLLEILKDKPIYYESSIDIIKYIKLNTDGERAVIEWIKLIAPKMLQLEKQKLDMHAKQLVLQELKNEL